MLSIYRHSSLGLVTTDALFTLERHTRMILPLPKT
jgi:hypothetical protein